MALPPSFVLPRPPHPPPPPHGLVGMRERATMLGGGLEAGPTGDGGFRVTAVLPVSPPEEAP
jgi:signal transduction histidine kinase